MRHKRIIATAHWFENLPDKDISKVAQTKRKIISNGHYTRIACQLCDKLYGEIVCMNYTHTKHILLNPRITEEIEV
ncbi:MAG: hypothetical protein U9O94_06130 [Nanoarchaeota archaeon]|nr:hypothetical protein [Nanoarchaeota archaeon]